MKKEDGRVRITRQMIRTALLNLLREKPLQHITVRELCEKASINRGTFYAHYDVTRRSAPKEKLRAIPTRTTPQSGTWL